MSIFTLSGAVDGANRTYTSSQAYANTSAHIILNGRIFPRTDDTYALTELNSTQIQLATAPSPGDIVELLADPFGTVGGSLTFTAPGPRWAIEEVIYNTANQTLNLRAEVNGNLITPTGTPTFATYVNGGSTEATATPIDSGNCGGSGGVITATFTTVGTGKYALQQLYRCLVSFVYNSTTYVREVLFRVVRVVYQDACPIGINELIGSHKRMAASLNQLGQSGDAIDRYIIPAWEEVRETLMADGIQIHTVNNVSLKTVTRYLAMCNAARGMMNASDDVWAKLLDEWKTLYKEAMARLVTLSRRADTNTVEAERGFAQPRIGYGPDRGMAVSVPLPYSGMASGPLRGLR